MRSAAEAVVGLPGRADREARRLLAVEGTQALVHAAGALELDVATDHLEDVDAREQFLNEAVGQHGGSLAARPSRPRHPTGARGERCPARWHRPTGWPCRQA